MSRYRPPRPPASPYITQPGHDRLQRELSYLWKEKRPAVTKKVSEAAAMGDRSENAEYIYGKRQLREIDARIQFLSKRLDNLQIIDKRPPDGNRVFFAAWVTLKDDDNQVHRYRIVGADEFDVQPDYISIDAPLSRALIGRQLGDEVSISQQRDDKAPLILQPNPTFSETTYTIENVEYE